MKRRHLVLVPCTIAAGALLWWLAGRGPGDGPGAGRPQRDTATRVGVTIDVPRPVGDNPVERLRAFVGAGHDAFDVEAAEEQLREPLRRFARWLEAPAGVETPGVATTVEGAGELPGGLVTDSFSVAAVTWTPAIGADGTSVATGHPLAPQRLPRAAGASQVRALFSPHAQLDRVELKLTRVDREPNGLRTRVLLNAHARLESQSTQWSGVVEMDWLGNPPRLEAWRPTELDRTTLESNPFADVTAATLSHNPTYGPLLRQSLDTFRGQLDAASGIDVYGHHGLAVADFDGDGRDDVYVAMAAGLPNLLLRGEADGRLTDITKRTGLDILDGTSQPLALDSDNDGDADMILVVDGGVLLLKNNGKGEFSPVPEAFPAMREKRATPVAVTAADYDADGLVDVYVTAYVFSRGASSDGGSRLPFPYHEAHNGAPNFLFRNAGNDRFVDVTETVGLAANNRRFSFSAAWADYDDDGDPDLYVANDFGSNNLYRNDGERGFVEVTREAGVADVGAGMSVAWEDYDLDGDLDLYVGNMLSSAGRRVTGTTDYKATTPALQSVYRRHARGNSLFRNRGDGTFEEVSEDSSAYFGRWAWASGFVDFNLDGYSDIYVQNGFLTNPRETDL